jgi:hypothetical protein
MDAALVGPPGPAARDGAPASAHASVERGGNVLTVAAAGLLLLTLVWRVVLVTWMPTPVRARELLASLADTTVPGRLVLLVDAPGTRSSREAADRARQAWPGFPLGIHAAGLPGAAPERLRSLAESYGYSRLPLLLTLDQEGHVVRITPM